MAASTVTGNTSVVLVSTAQTIVYLSSVGYPGHIVTIQDIGGVASQGNPIVVSTTKDIFFADGSISTLLFTPNGLVTASSKTPTVWQLLNNVGFLTSLSNAYVSQVTVGNGFISLLSSSQEYVSSSVIGNVNVTKSLNLLGDVVILGDITIGGVVDLFSTLDVRQDINLSSGLTIYGNAAFNSSLFVQDTLTVNGILSTLQDLVIGENLSVSSFLVANQVLVPRNISVQSLKMGSLEVAGGIQSAEGFSVGSNFFTTGSFTGLSSATFVSSFTVGSTTNVKDTLLLNGIFTTSSLQVFSSGFVGLEAYAGSLRTGGILSTGNSFYLGGNLVVGQRTNVSSVVVTGSVTTNSLIVKGNAEISTIVLQGDMRVAGGTTMLFSSLLTSSIFATNVNVTQDITLQGIANVSTSFSTLANFNAGGNVLAGQFNVRNKASISSGISTSGLVAHDVVSTNALYVAGDLNVIGPFTLLGEANVGVLGAPIAIILSTLTLSNTLSVKGPTTIPDLVATSNLYPTYPTVLRVGQAAKTQNFTTYINVNGDASIRSALQDLNTGGPETKAISSLRVSTLQNTNILSSFIVGANTFAYPTVPTLKWLIVGGSNFSADYPTFTASAVYSNVFSYWYSAFYSPETTTWVGVGQGGFSSRSLKYSKNYGSTWNDSTGAQFGGFFGGTGYDVIYMSTTYQNIYAPMWVAAGSGNSSGTSNNALLYSGDGISFSNASGGFGTSGTGRSLLFYPGSGTGEGAIALAGGEGPLQTFGIYYSDDGINWINATNVQSVGLACSNISIGSNRELLAVGQDTSVSFPYPSRIFRAPPGGYQGGWSTITLARTPNPTTVAYNGIAFGNGWYVLIAKGSSFPNPAVVYRSTDLFNWQPVTTFYANTYNGPNQVIFDNDSSLFTLIGSADFSQPGQPNYIFQSANGFLTYSQILITSAASLQKAIKGQLINNDTTSKYFTANVETRFQTAISTTSLNASTIRASTIFAGNYIGSNSGLSNIVSFSAEMGISSLSSHYLAINSTFQFFYSTLASTLIVSSAITYLSPASFPSTVSLWIGGGVDSEENGNIQLSQSLTGWNRASNADFDIQVNAVVGNNDPFFSFFIATGATTDPTKVVQYSENGYEWSPITTPTFTVPNSATGYYTGTTAAYGMFYSTIGFTTQSFYTYIVAGYNEGAGTTIFYSYDGRNFNPATSPLGANIFGSYIKRIQFGGGYALALTSYSQFIRSADGGKTWSNIATRFPIGLDAGVTGSGGGFAYGYKTTFNPVWYAVDYRQNQYESTDNGFTFTDNGLIGGIQPAQDLVFADTGNFSGYWIAQGINAMYLTSTPTNLNFAAWTPNKGPFAFTGAAVTMWESLFYNSNTQVWFAGATAENASNTLWVSSNAPPNRAAGVHWLPITSGGFSTGIDAIGAGYAITSSPIPLDPFNVTVIVGGAGSFTGRSPLQPNITRFNPTFSFFGGTTSTILTQANANNILSTAVYGLAYTSSPSFEYNYIAVGDGPSPAKTIARTNLYTPWVTATTGGFSPAGYGVIYYSTPDVFLAVGKSPASTATIQYSPDGANWYATNKSGSLPRGGRGICKFSDTSFYPNRLVAVGEGTLGDYFTLTGSKTSATSDDGFTWTYTDVGLCNQFTGAAYGVAAGNFTSDAFGYGPGVIAVGLAQANFSNTAVPDSTRSIMHSQDGSFWFPSRSGGFEVAGYGIAYGRFNGFDGQDHWVAVGENSNPGSNTIKYSVDGVTWLDTTSGSNFYFAGYGVAYVGNNQRFVAVGKGLTNRTTVLSSTDGSRWDLLAQASGSSPQNGFLSQQFFGSAYGLFSQQVTTRESEAFVDMPKLIFYGRSNALVYGAPTVRLTSTSITLNEAATVNLSSQLMINTFTPVGSNTVTVNGSVRTSTFYYTGSEPKYQNVNFSSIIVSTLQFTDVMLGFGITTPSLGIGPYLYDDRGSGNSLLEFTRYANFIGPSNDLDTGVRKLNVNDTIYTRLIDLQRFYMFPGNVGIGTNNPLANVDVSGTAGCSTFSTMLYRQSTIALLEPNLEYIQNPNLAIYEGPDPFQYSHKNTIYSEPSSINFNTILSINLSTQKVGCYTSNPQYGLDARNAGWFSNLRTDKVNAAALFFTLQTAL
jgi:hypothetical protein